MSEFRSPKFAKMNNVGGYMYNEASRLSCCPVQRYKS